nr:TPA_asm: ND2 [Bombus nevadensis]
MLNKFYLSSLMLIFFMFSIMMNTSSIYIQWLMMEFCTIIGISLINIKSMNKIISILYFMISSISSLFIIIFISMNYSMLMIKNMNFNMIIMISMMFKLGIFPFWFWMIYIYEMSSWNQIFIISTILKFIPIYFFSSLLYFSSNLFFFLTMNNILIPFFMNYNFSIKKLFACSSIFNSLFFLFIIFINKNMFIFFMFIYMLIFFFITYILNYYNIKNLNFNFMSTKMLNLFKIMMFIYSSFPLFLMFLFKWSFIYNLTLINIDNNLIMILLLSSTLMIWNYLILFKYLMLKFNFLKNNLKMEIFSMKNLYFIFIFFYSLMFLLFNLM